MKRKKVTTIQELYAFLQEHMVTQGQFKEHQRQIDKRFEGIDKKFEGIDKKFEGIDKKFEGIDIKFEEMEKKFDKKLEKMENKIMNHIDGFIVLHEKVLVELIALRSQYNRLEERVQRLEAQRA